MPIWARHYSPLLNAICATSSRHLYRTATASNASIQYEGELLPNLDAHSSVEYMLACIPALRSFHETNDIMRKKLIVATAIVLRQFEEMENEEDCSHITDTTQIDNEVRRQSQVNFLDIINTIIRDSHNKGDFNHQGFLDVAYWICLRQEVYSAFTQKRVPQMLLAPEQWASAAPVNKMVMHAAQVAKWLSEDRNLEEWRMHSSSPSKRTTADRSRSLD